ncbi:hypothetical protein DXG03_006283 [Asterophora parasitica]|uniref:BTB domain-containing protein n=1 Tax=Asterophora parasitica TaxID=117018 RepID=A0A9P7G2T0_9AGAR|nr:hypothetical protein DXG03_006283 [Asterophora parasitica]
MPRSHSAPPTDGVLFHIPKRNLLFSGPNGFPGMSDPSQSGLIIDLAESGSILNFVFQFIARGPQPALKNIEFTTLAVLADAVEKYRVYPATQLCCLLMLQNMHKDPISVLDYAMKYKYFTVANTVAPLATLTDLLLPHDRVPPGIVTRLGTLLPRMDEHPTTHRQPMLLRDQGNKRQRPPPLRPLAKRPAGNHGYPVTARGTPYALIEKDY